MIPSDLEPSIPVGGEIIPIDTTMVLAAGAQYTAAWMIPVIVSGIGFVILSRYYDSRGSGCPLPRRVKVTIANAIATPIAAP